VHILRHEVATDNNFSVIKDQAVGMVAAQKKIGISNLHLRGKGVDYTRFELFCLFVWGRFLFEDIPPSKNRWSPSNNKGVSGHIVL
jgi:hypothetical protein